MRRKNVIVADSSANLFQADCADFMPVPLKILAGEKDTLVNISGSQKAAEAYEAAGADVRFQTIPGGKHIFRSPKHIKTAVNAISEFACSILSEYVP